MRIFLTAAASRGDQTQWVAARLRGAGHVVSSTWHRAHLAGLEAMAATVERHQQVAGSDAVIAHAKEASDG